MGKGPTYLIDAEQEAEKYRRDNRKLPFGPLSLVESKYETILSLMKVVDM